jgi:hypothetical protein
MLSEFSSTVEELLGGPVDDLLAQPTTAVPTLLSLLLLLLLLILHLHLLLQKMYH